MKAIRLMLSISLLFRAAPSLALDVDKALESCKLGKAERRMATLVFGAAGQKREQVECDPRLQAFAMMRAKDMADRDYFGHVNPDRKGPNELLRKTGYEMPKYYVGGIANSIESILAGRGDVDEAFKLLMESRVHRKHLMGEDNMYLKQDKFGIAYLDQPDSKFAHYWVIVIVENGKDERPMTCTPAPPVCIVH